MTLTLNYAGLEITYQIARLEFLLPGAIRDEDRIW
jgi:hypothetical protein